MSAAETETAVETGTTENTSVAESKAETEVLGKDGTAFDPERAQRTIEAARSDARALKAERDALAAKLKEREDAEKTETQKLADRVAELEAEKTQATADRKATNVRLGVYSLRDELQIADADLTVAALDHSLLVFDDDGKPTNLSELVTDLLERKPLLKTTEPVQRKAADLNAGDGTGGEKPPDLTAEELEMAKRLGKTPEQYATMKNIKNLNDWQELQSRQKT